MKECLIPLVLKNNASEKLSKATKNYKNQLTKLNLLGALPGKEIPNILWHKNKLPHSGFIFSYNMENDKTYNINIINYKNPPSIETPKTKQSAWKQNYSCTFYPENPILVMDMTFKKNSDPYGKAPTPISGIYYTEDKPLFESHTLTDGTLFSVSLKPQAACGTLEFTDYIGYDDLIEHYLPPNNTSLKKIKKATMQIAHNYVKTSLENTIFAGNKVFDILQSTKVRLLNTPVAQV